MTVQREIFRHTDRRKGDGKNGHVVRQAYGQYGRQKCIQIDKETKRQIGRRIDNL